MRAMRPLGAVLLLISTWACGRPQEPRPYEIRFDATRPRAEMAPEGASLFVAKKCSNCHLTKGTLVTAGPNLRDVGARLEARDLELWIRDPRRQKSDSKMPPFDGTEDQVEALVAYLLTLK